jgi:hypothetical protein
LLSNHFYIGALPFGYEMKEGKIAVIVEVPYQFVNAAEFQVSPEDQSDQLSFFFGCNLVADPLAANLTLLVCEMGLADYPWCAHERHFEAVSAAIRTKRQTVLA